MQQLANAVRAGNALLFAGAGVSMNSVVRSVTPRFSRTHGTPPAGGVVPRGVACPRPARTRSQPTAINSTPEARNP